MGLALRFGAVTTILLALSGCASLDSLRTETSPYAAIDPGAEYKGETSTKKSDLLAFTVRGPVNGAIGPEWDGISNDFALFMIQNDCDTNTKTNSIVYLDANGTTPQDPTKSVKLPRCAKRVIQLAIDTCVKKSIREDIFEKYANYGFYGVLAATGLAGGVAALSHASSAETTEITATTAGVTTLATNLQKGEPTSAQASISTLESSAEAYLKVADFSDGKITPDSYSKLYNAVFSTCPSGTF